MKQAKLSTQADSGYECIIIFIDNKIGVSHTVPGFFFFLNFQKKKKKNIN